MSIKAFGIDAVILKTKKQIDIYLQHKSKEILEQAVARLAENTPVLTGRAKRGWMIKPAGAQLRITNDVPYIGELNEGHSPQAPARFVEATLLSIPEIRPNGIIVLDVEDT